ncbi:MAG: hypothetical protein GY795_10975 [Desulfobacterales bacterium]|nr:hypothetical protein [Desulfobacterales bacterium]
MREILKSLQKEKQMRKKAEAEKKKAEADLFQKKSSLNINSGLALCIPNIVQNSHKASFVLL